MPQQEADAEDGEDERAAADPEDWVLGREALELAADVGEDAVIGASPTTVVRGTATWGSAPAPQT